MRQLTTNDVFKMSRILKRLNLSVSDIQVADGENSDQQLFLSLAVKIAENVHLAQNEANDFLGDLCGMSGEEFGNLPLTETIEKVKEFKGLDGISNFFKYAGQLTN